MSIILPDVFQRVEFFKNLITLYFFSHVYNIVIRLLTNTKTTTTRRWKNQYFYALLYEMRMVAGYYGMMTTGCEDLFTFSYHTCYQCTKPQNILWPKCRRGVCVLSYFFIKNHNRSRFVISKTNELIIIIIICIIVSKASIWWLPAYVRRQRQNLFLGRQLYNFHPL